MSTWRVVCLTSAIVLGACALAERATGQSFSDSPKPAASIKGFTWTESYEGSGNTTGWISDINSTVGYNFGSHFGLHVGIPYYMFQPSSTQVGVAAAYGVGNPYVGFNYSRKAELLSFTTGVNASAPISTTKKDGLSTGRVTFDWSNRLDHDFGFVTPFVSFGVGNSVPDTQFIQRQFISLGMLAHFEAGPEFDLGDKFSISASGYDIAPWGLQKIFTRGKTGSGGETTGTAALTRDYGANFGVDFNATKTIDISAGYSRSVALSANTFSAGISFNLIGVLRRHSNR